MDVAALAPHALVATATSDPDPDQRRAAQRSIVAASSLRVARTVVGGTIADKLALIDSLGSDEVPRTILPVVLAGLGRPSRDDAGRVLDRVRRHRAAELGVVVVHAVGDFVRAVALEVEPRAVLQMLDWASGDELDDGDHVVPFVAAAAEVLDRVPATRLDEYRFATGMTQLFAVGGATAAPLLDRWLAAPATAELVLRRMFDVHGQRQRRGEDRRMVEWLAALWARTPDRGVLAPSLGIATSQNRGITGRDWFADWAWARFVDHPGERAALYLAFASWRDELIARRNTTPRATRPGGASAVDHLRVWGPLDLDRLGGVIDEAARLAEPADWAPLVDEVFAIAAAARGDDRMAGLVGACRIAQELTNRVRDRDEEPPLALELAVDRLIAHGRAVLAELRADGLAIDPQIANRIEDLETSIRLCLEARARRAEDEQRARDRAAADAQRERDRQRMEDDARRMQDEARRAQEEAQRRQQELIQALHGGRPPAAIGQGALPQLELTSLDREPFFGGPLPSLLDYARFMVRVRHGGDTLAVMAEHGLDPLGFSAVAQAWSQLIGARPDLAARFGALLSASWA